MLNFKFRVRFYLVHNCSLTRVLPRLTVEYPERLMEPFPWHQTTTGNAEKMWEYLKVYGAGTFEVPLKHDIPIGRYLISLNFKNEGYSKDVNDCFTIIVK
jgi:hypothetical protein